MSCFEVEGDLVAAADDRFASALRHVVKEEFVSPKRRFRRLLGCCAPFKAKRERNTEK